MNVAVQRLERGLWGVLATPFAGPRLSVDEESLRREVRHFLGVPATGLVALGVFGEGAVLDSAEQALVVRSVLAEAGDLPVVVGVSARSTAVAVEQARAAVEAAGRPLAGIMVQAHTNDAGVLSAHFAAVHEATATGIVLQDYPEASGVRLTADVVLAVLDRCPFVAAVKAEAPPTAAAISTLTASTDVPVFGGLGGVGLLDELAAGAAGAMTGFSHPEGLHAALAGWDEGGFPAARERFAPWLPLVNFEAQPGVGLALRKAILQRRGLFTEAVVRPPARSLPDGLARLIEGHLLTVPTA